MGGNQENFWCSRHLDFIWCHFRWRVCCWSLPFSEWSRSVERQQTRARWDPICTSPTSSQSSPQWLRTLSTHQQPSKGACPPAHPELVASLKSPSPYYWQKKSKSWELLNHSNTASPKVATALTDYTLSCSAFSDLVHLKERKVNTNPNKLHRETLSTQPNVHAL